MSTCDVLIVLYPLSCLLGSCTTALKMEVSDIQSAAATTATA